MEHLLEFFHSEHDDDLLDCDLIYVDLQMIQVLLLVSPPSKIIQSILCCFINMEERIFQSKFHDTLLYFCPNQGHCGWPMKTRYMYEELVIFCFLSYLLHYISRGASILFSMSPFHNHLIRCSQILSFLLKFYV